MDWIEQLFGFAPDGGDGSTEALIVLVACLVVSIVICLRVPQIKMRLRNLLGLGVQN